MTVASEVAVVMASTFLLFSNCIINAMQLLESKEQIGKRTDTINSTLYSVQYPNCQLVAFVWTDND